MERQLDSRLDHFSVVGHATLMTLRVTDTWHEISGVRVGLTSRTVAVANRKMELFGV